MDNLEVLVETLGKTINRNLRESRNLIAICGIAFSHTIIVKNQ